MKSQRTPPNSADPSGPAEATDFKKLYRRLESALVAIERTEDVAKTLESILDTLVAGYRDEFGLNGGRIYKREEDGYSLCCGFGTSHDSTPNLDDPSALRQHLKTLDEGVLILRPGEPGHDQLSARGVTDDSIFAAIAVGADNRYVIAFSIDAAAREHPVLYSLTAVRHVINLKLEQQQVTNMLEESRAIQESMLPTSPPMFSGYDIDGRSRPAELVNGDLFDFLPLSNHALGIAIADASGHGVPAALMARDVITGLRMLADDEIEVGQTVERLNRVIHRAALSSKFVSLFYGKLALDGRFVYCNAGHNPPLLQRAGTCLELTPGGPVLGPIPGAPYTIGNEHLGADDTLVMFTDGVVERENAAGQQFGTERLRELLQSTVGARARDVIESIYTAVDSHSGDEPLADDMTIVVVRRT